MKIWITWSKKAAPWLLMIGVWEVLSRIFPPVPSALRILGLAGSRLADPVFLEALAGSLRRMAVGYLTVCVTGILAGVVVGRFRWLNELLGTIAVSLHAMPGVVWVPLAILFFGMTETAVIFTIFLGASGIIMVSTSDGIKDVPPNILRAARTMGAGGGRIFWHVVVPAAIPRIVDGLRLAWAFGWRALMAGELLIPSLKGLGQMINEVARRRELDQLLAFMLLIALIGVLADYFLFRPLETVVRARWGT